jgi:hypothetical protein
MGLMNRLPLLNHAHSDPYVGCSSAVRELVGVAATTETGGV